MSTKLFIIFLFLFYFSAAIGQQAQHGQLQKSSYTKDTFLINQQIKKAHGYAQNPATLDSANYYLEQFYSLSKRIKYDKGIIEYFRIKAVTYFLQQKEDSVAQYIQMAYDQAKLYGNQKEQALVLDLKAWIFQAKEENDSATHYYIEALKIADKLEDNKFSAEISNNLSMLFLAIGDADKATEYANKVYHIGRKLSDTMLITNGLFNRGNAKLQVKKYDSAMVLYNSVNELVKDPVKYNYVLFRALSNEASIFTDQGNFNEGIAKYKNILSLLPGADPSILSYVYAGLGTAQLKAKRLNEAENSLYKSIENGTKAGQTQVLRDSYLLLSEIKEAQTNFKEAFEYLKKYEVLNDTLTSQNTSKNMHLLERKYNTATKDNQIANQQLTLIKNKNIIQSKDLLNFLLAGGLILILIIAVSIFRNFKQRQKLSEKEKELQKQKIIELEKAHQMLAMQSIIQGQEEERSRLARDLHDGVGSLLSGVKLSMSSMKGNVFLSEENAHAFNNVIAQLDLSIAELRRVSHNMMPEALIKYGLKEALENYCENLNHSGKIKVQLQAYGMDQRLDQNSEIIIYRIVQELLTNILKHAEATNVLIQFIRKEDKFTLTVEDDGKGFNAKELNNKNGAGLANIRARAEYLNGSVDIVSKKEEGTSVTIEGKVEGVEVN